MNRRVHRFTVPIDDQAHDVRAAFGAPLGVIGAVRETDGGGWCVEFWAETREDWAPRPHRYQVFGTGHALPHGAWWAGTTPRGPEGLVWHLYLLCD